MAKTTQVQRVHGVLAALLTTAGLVAAQEPSLELESFGPRERGAFRGQLEVPEDRTNPSGRRISLHVVVLRARAGERARPDPVFYLAGGPGQSAAAQARHLAGSWLRRDRDMVLVDQRGTGQSNPLRVDLPGRDGDVQGYLGPIFDEPTFRRGLARLRERADLTQYTTPIAMDDLDDVRAALGYETVNLIGGSYGTRAALIYMRRHPERVRTAILTGVAPVAFLNPLYHAAAAQEGWDTLVSECRRDPRYRDAFGDLDAKLDEILERLERAPASVALRHPATGQKVTVSLDRDAFAEALRVMMYYMRTNRQVPLLVHRAHAGDYRAFAERGIASNRGIRDQLAFGMLMCVVGSEDIPRIQPGDVERLTAGTFLGDRRVRDQMAVSGFWPRGEVPASYGDPVSVDVPTLLISGRFDPVTPPRWGMEAASHLPNSVHIVVPEAHGTSAREIEELKREFLAAGSVDDLDISFVDEMTAPPLAMPRGQ